MALSKGSWYIAVAVLVMAFVSCSGEGSSGSPAITPEPNPISDEPRLTGSEAAEMTRRFLLEKAEEFGVPASNVARILCDAEDFNRRDKAWIVRCVNTGLVNVSFRVFDATGRVEVIQ